jgi:hypothetical protein
MTGAERYRRAYSSTRVTTVSIELLVDQPKPTGRNFVQRFS